MKPLSGRWLSPTHLKNDGVSNSWDDDIPKKMESLKSHVPKHTQVLLLVGGKRLVTFGVLVESP